MAQTLEKLFNNRVRMYLPVKMAESDEDYVCEEEEDRKYPRRKMRKKHTYIDDLVSCSRKWSLVITMHIS